MKKIDNVKIDVISLGDVYTDPIATSNPGFGGTPTDAGNALVGGRFFFDNGSYQGETFDNDYDYSSHYE